MPRVAITINSIAKLAGDNELTLTSADAANGHTMVNDGRTILLVQNYDASARTVTVKSVADPVTGRTGDIALSVPAASGGVAGTACFNFLPQHLFNQSGQSYVHVDINAATNVKLAAVSLAPFVG